MNGLEIEGLRAGYNGADVISDISFTVQPGELVAVLGANGAGKTTLANTIIGLLRARGGEIVVDGASMTKRRVTERVAAGIALVPEGRALFPTLTVEETLRLGAVKRGRQGAEQRLATVFHLFPVLEDRSRQAAGTLSGGEQQMLAIGRALMSDPRYLIMDEPSLGLAPKMAWAIASQLSELRSKQLGIVLIEQNSALALELCTYGLIMRRGSVALSGTKDDLHRVAIRNAYLGHRDG